MSYLVSNVLWLFAGFAMCVVGLWSLLVRLPAEHKRQKTMLAAEGIIQDGLSGSNAFKLASNLARGRRVAAVPMVAYTTHEGHEVIANIGWIQDDVTFEIGEDVWLRYDPLDPNVVMLDGQPRRTTTSWTISGFLLLVGSLLTHSMLEQLMRDLP